MNEQHEKRMDALNVRLKQLVQVMNNYHDTMNEALNSW